MYYPGGPDHEVQCDGTGDFHREDWARYLAREQKEVEQKAD